jgi:hypothetical protein
MVSPVHGIMPLSGREYTYTRCSDFPSRLFRAWLTEVTQLASDLSQIAFEEVRAHAGTDAAHLYGGFLAHLSAWCEERTIAYQGVPVGTIKRYATGKGNADKAAMIAAMRARGFAPADDNEADALALLLWATDAEGGRA